MWNIWIYSERAVCRSSMSCRVSQKGGRRMIEKCFYCQDEDETCFYCEFERDEK